MYFPLVTKHKSDLSPTVSSIIDSTFDLIPKDTNLSAFNESFLQDHTSSAKHIFSVIQTRQTLLASSSNTSDTEGTDSDTLILEILDNKTTTLKEAIEGLSMLKESKGDVAKYLEQARKRWPLAECFKEKS